MGRRTDYEHRLAAGERPDDLVTVESGLPGPRANLELVAAIAATSEPDALLAWSDLGPDEVRGDEPQIVLVLGGVVGLGRLAADGWQGSRGRQDLVARLHGLAADPRWRVREGVAMAIQRWADDDPAAAFATAERWQADAPLVQRAAVAAVCEPRLLTDPAFAARALAVVDAVTVSLAERPVPTTGDRGSSEDIRVLRTALGYGWSVVIVALPDRGKPAFERWLEASDPDVEWIVRANLDKRRLERLDAAWVADLRRRVERHRRRAPASQYGG